MAKDHKKPDQGREAAHAEKHEFRKEGGAAVGTKDSVVEGRLAGIAGSTEKTYRGHPKDRQAQTRCDGALIRQGRAAKAQTKREF